MAMTGVLGKSGAASSTPKLKRNKIWKQCKFPPSPRANAQYRPAPLNN